MGLFDAPQVKLDAAGSFNKGFNAMDQYMANQQRMNAQNQALSQKAQELSQQQAVTQLGQQAAKTGDPRAIAMFSAINPTGGAAIRENTKFFTDQGLGDLQAIQEAKITDRPAIYRMQMDRLKQNPYFDASEYPDEYSPEVDSIIGADLVSGKDLSRTYSLQDTPEGLMTFESETGMLSPTGRMGSAGLAAQEKRLDIAKKQQELQSEKEQRAAAAEQGISTKAYKKEQEVLGTAGAEKKIDLPRIQSQGKLAVNLIKEIVSHPGMSSMVGAKSGAGLTTYLPFVDEPIQGTKAAGFKAKFDQMQGKNFLAAYQTLKGGGQITEVEGKKATDAMSAMKLSTSEKEFKQNAKDLVDVINIGVVRAGGEPIPFDFGGKESSKKTTKDTPVGGIKFLGFE